MKINKILTYLLSMPKTIWFNFRYFPFLVAIRLPVFISHHVLLMTLGGTVRLGVISTGMVKIGFGDVGVFDRHRSRTIWQVTGCVEFRGQANIGHGSKISVAGNLIIGNYFIISAESTIVCQEKIIFGSNVLLSWDVLIMDSDFHHIYDENGSCINSPMAIHIGNNIWIGCRSLILKGVTIADGVVVAANTTITKSINTIGVIVGGTPVRILKEKITWEM